MDASFKQADIVHSTSAFIRNPNAYDPIEVALFHTHPPLTYGDKSFKGSIPTGPSAPDIANAEDLKIPGFVWCYATSIKVNHDIDDSNGVVEYSKEQREFNK